MIRRLIAVGTVAASSLMASASSAQTTGNFGQKGEFIFSADRLFDIFAYGNNRSHPDNTTNQDTVVQGTSIGLFGGTSANAFGTIIRGYGTVYNIPRLGFDYTIIDNLTLGGDVLLYFALGGGIHQDPNPTSQDLPSGSLFGVFPRVGYIININDLIAFWLRGGVHFWNAQANQAGGQGSANAHAFGIDLDPSIVITPVQHFGFFAGPALDWGFLGGGNLARCDNAPCNQQTYNYFTLQSLNFSLSAGLLGWF
jgi:hypothetical protein